MLELSKTPMVDTLDTIRELRKNMKNGAFGLVRTFS